MMKLMLVLGTMAVVAGCAGSTGDSTGSTTAAVTASSSSSSSGGDNAGGHDGHHRGPPPEAFTACEGKAAGDACTVTHDDQTLTGTCVAPPADAPDARIACRPDNMPEGGRPHGDGDGDGDGKGGPGAGHGDCQGGGAPPPNGQNTDSKPADSTTNPT